MTVRSKGIITIITMERIKAGTPLSLLEEVKEFFCNFFFTENRLRKKVLKIIMYMVYWIRLFNYLM